MSEILVAVDGSPPSVNTLRWGAALAGRMGIRVTAVTVWGPRTHAAFEVPAHLSKETAQSQITAALHEVVADAGLVGVEVMAVPGKVSEALHDMAAAPGVVALVMGTRGLGTIPGLLLGSMSRRMLFDCASPLILVPGRPLQEFHPLDEVVAALDGSPMSALVAAWTAATCARLGARATVVRCVDPGAELPVGHIDTYLEEVEAEVEERWCAPFAHLDVDHRVEVVRGDPRNMVLEIAEKNSAGLLVVAGRGAGQFQGLGGTTSFLVRHCQLPLAVVPSTEGWEPTGF